MAALGLCGLLLLLLPEVALPRPTELTAAAGDVVELERLSTRLGPARLLVLAEEAANRRQARLSLVALRGLGLLGAAQPDLGLQLLRPFGESLLRLGQARRLDEKQAAVASESLQRVALAVGRAPGSAEGEQADGGSALGEAAESLYSVAAAGALPLTLRGGALEGLAQLPPASWQRLVPGVVKLATAGPTAPERAAMVALASLVLRDRGEPLFALVRTGDPAVASPAAAELCAVMAQGGSRGKASPAPLLSDELASRVRELAGPTQPLPQRLLTVECLRLLATPPDRALLQAIVSEAKRGRR